MSCVTEYFILIRRALIVATFFTGTVLAESAFPERYTPKHEYTGQSVWELSEVPEDEIDVGLWALIMAKEADSSVDIPLYLKTLDGMAAEIKRMVAGRNRDMVKMVMTKMFLYDTGQWNGGNTFLYDLDDPMGERPGARLLTTYLDSRKGNCVSMPTLFLALMERVDPNVRIHGACAPMHLFCRLHDQQDGQVWNVETTNGGNPARDEWYLERFQISQLAIDSGVYLTDLTKKQFLAELVGILVSKYRQVADYNAALQYADLMLQLNSRSVTGLVQKGALLGWLGHTFQETIKSENRPPTAAEKQTLELYRTESESYIEKAKSLGWEPESPEFRDRYLKAVRGAKTDN